LEIKSDYGDALCNLANALLKSGKAEEAIVFYRRGLELRPDDGDVRTNFANALAQEGNTSEAIAQYRLALINQPDNPTALSNVAWLLATSSEESLRDGKQAVALAEHLNRITGDEPIVLRILAAAYAEAGDFPNARSVGVRALQLAESAGARTLTASLEKEIALYQSGFPYHKS